MTPPAPARGRVDLHAHSTASDGRLRPAEVVRLAAEVGLAGVALTDHDTLDGVEEAREEALRLGIEFVPGVELSASYGDVEVHILGYFADPADERLAGLLREMREARRGRIRAMVERLQRMGVPVKLEEVLAEGGHSSGRPHIARVLVRKGVVADVPEAFERFLAEGRPAYVPRAKLDAVEASRVLRAAGAVPVWAHPGAHAGSEGLLDALRTAGLGGIEVWHPEHDLPTSRSWHRVALDCGLIATAGSDFHAFEERVPLGTYSVPLDTVRALRARATRPE
ncbi:MAG: PHP domain-containing protein [Clostridia bacterium]|nr:PHP domain-containing protein [Clostridia bacterium]